MPVQASSAIELREMAELTRSRLSKIAVVVVCHRKNIYVYIFKYLVTTLSSYFAEIQ